MSFWDRFRKRTKAEENPAAEEKQKPEWNDIVYTRKDLNCMMSVKKESHWIRWRHAGRKTAQGSITAGWVKLPKK